MVQTKTLGSARGAGAMSQQPLDPKAFGARLVGSRIAAGLNQDELAKRSGVGKRSIEGYEAGIRFPLSGVPALAEALGVDAHWLVFGTSWDVEKLGELAGELRHQTESFHQAMELMDKQWQAFRARFGAIETRLLALEVLNERIYMVLNRLLEREAPGTAGGELRRLLGPAPPLDVEPPEPE